MRLFEKQDKSDILKKPAAANGSGMMRVMIEIKRHRRLRSVGCGNDAIHSRQCFDC